MHSLPRKQQKFQRDSVFGWKMHLLLVSQNTLMLTAYLKNKKRTSG